MLGGGSVTGPYRKQALELIRGAYDLHTHTTPSHVPRSLDDFDLVREASQLGMAGVMIKCHYEPTGARAELVNRHSGVKTKAYGSLVLNWPLGGLNPYAVESGLKMGARIVWMPTRDSENSLRFGDMPGDFFTRPGISLYDEAGKIKKTVFEILEVVKKNNVCLATGHLSPAESCDLCQTASSMGARMILTHPEWPRTVVPLEKQLELSKRGVLVEKLWLNIAECSVTAEYMAKTIRALGFDNVFMATDRGQAGCERPAEGMLRFIERMLALGIGETDVRKMICDVPASIVE